MSSVADNAQSVDDVMEELVFQKTMLASIDENTVDREQGEAEIKAEIKALERRLMELQRGNTTTRSSPFQSTSSNPSQGSASGHQLGTPSMTHAGPSGSLSSTTSTPKSNSTFDSASEQMDLPSRKRSHSTHLDGENTAEGSSSAAKRLTPSPFPSVPGTPSSSGDEGFEVFNQQLNQRFLQQQKELEERIALEKRDAEFARSIQEGSSMGGAAPTVQAGPSAFQMISGVRAPPSVSNSARPMVKNEPTMFTHVKQEPAGPASFMMPGTYHEDSSDSEIEIIPSHAFQDNGRFQSRPTPQYSPGARAAGAAALQRVQQMTTNASLQMALYGKSATDWTKSAPTPSGSAPNVPHPGGTINAGGLLSSGGQPTSSLGLGLGHMNNAIPGFKLEPSSDPLGRHVYSLDESEIRPYDPHSVAGQIDYVVNDPRKTHQEIADLLANIRPDSDLPAEDREGTPEGLKYPLYEHQKLALTWMKAMESGSNKGGILADDMGLGKTISTLALILSQPSTERSRKTTLIVGPVALVRQWQREIKVKVKGTHTLTTYLKHGPTKKPSWDDLWNYDIVLTTYGTLAAEFKRYEKFEAEQLQQGIKEWDPKPLKKKFPLLGPKSVFYRIVLDEAQWIKNKATGSARSACHLKSTYRWCLTGTPMQNSVAELYSLIRFLRIKPYNSLNRFNEEFGSLTARGKPQRRSDSEATMRKLQALIRAILLRRMKTSMIDGKPIIVLPPKVEHIQHVVFNEDEAAYYKALETHTQIIFNKYVKAGTVGKNYSNMLVLLLRLRQACDHVHLIQLFSEAETSAGPAADLSAQVSIDLAKSLEPEVVARIVAAEAFECPVCYDASENPTIVIPCGHDTCSECLSKISDQAVQANIAEGNGEGAPTYKCPTCRGVLQMDKIIDYRTFKQVHMPDAVVGEQLPLAEDDYSETESDDSTDSDSETESEADDNGDLRDFIVPDDVDDTEVEATADEDEADEDDDHSDRKKRNSRSQPKPKSKKRSKRDRKLAKARKGKAKEDLKKQPISFAMMKKDASKNIAARRRYMRYLRKNYLPSAKVDQCVELLDQFHQDGQKTIVFSLFVSFLDILEVPIFRKGWKCERYDGSMSPDARNDSIMRFTDKADVNIMLISLKAGNAGLNLVAASRVIILEPFWNPYVSMQAVDRAYRIGQQKSVQVHHILIKETVEDRIIELQEQKRQLVDAALDEGAAKSLARLGERELSFLFGVNRG